VIRTVTGDVPPEEIGLAHSHEHLLARPLASLEPDLVLDDEAAALRDLAGFRAAGGDLLVEATTVDYGRDLAGLARLSAASGVRIVAATGFNKGAHCRPFTDGRDPADLAETQIADVRGGCGVVKFGTSLDRIEPWERVAAQAAALTHAATGCPVLTHTEAGTMAHEQLDLLEDHGVPADAVILCHLDRAPDLDLHLSLIERGATLSYDQLPKPRYATAEPALVLIAELAARGLADRVMAGGDLSRRSYFTGYGGAPGLAWLLTEWRARLDEATARSVFATAPRRALALR
jgi:predicted metal-dependent phosphotriesterase family hydrolase